MRIEVRRGLKFYITAWLHNQKEPYFPIPIIFKNYPEFLRGLNATPEGNLPFPCVTKEIFLRDIYVMSWRGRKRGG